MAAIRFLADMNISPKTIRTLRLKGWDIVRVSQFLPANASDQEVLHFARNEARVVVTQDLDFSTLIVSGGYGSPSLITLRLTATDPEAIAKPCWKHFPL